MKRIGAVLLLSAISNAVWAGRPFTTDDAGVLGRGECELESFYHRDSDKDTTVAKGWWLQPGCGYGLRSQLSVGYGIDTEQDEDAHSLALIGKTYIKALTEDSWGFSIGYGAGWTRLPGESRRFDTSYLTGIVSVPLGPVVLHGNLGWGRSRVEETTATQWAVLAEWEELLGPVDAGLEVYGDDHGSPWVQLGLRWPLVKDRMNIDASWGKQTGDTKGTVWTVGLKFMF